jgi:hypothetical protein
MPARSSIRKASWQKKTSSKCNKVTLEMSPYDLNKARIVFRHIEQRGAPAPRTGFQRRR